MAIVTALASAPIEVWQDASVCEHLWKQLEEQIAAIAAKQGDEPSPPYCRDHVFSRFVEEDGELTTRSFGVIEEEADIVHMRLLARVKEK